MATAGLEYLLLFLLLLLPVCRGKGNPSISGVKIQLGKQSKSHLDQVPPGPLVGWRVEKSLSPRPHTAKNSWLHIGKL